LKKGGFSAESTFRGYKDPSLLKCGKSNHAVAGSAVSRGKPKHATANTVEAVNEAAREIA
jgi:hypothetical protein